MKKLLLLIADAWAENTKYRYWCFDMQGLPNSITIKLYNTNLSKIPQGGTFFLDVHGTPTAEKFISDNLKK